MTRSKLVLAYLAVLALGVAGRHFLMANADVSWLLTVAEKMLDGGRLYTDMLENNPPMAVYLYVPAVALGRLLSVRPEVILDILIFALGFACVRWSCRRLPADVADVGPARGYLPPAAFAVVAVLPAFTFGEREHIALILFLPWLAIAIRRAHGAPIGFASAIFAGVAGGLVMSIKPHFALGLAAASLAAALTSRSWRPILGLENWIAGGFVVVYFALAIVLYPTYWNDLLPILALVYLPVRKPVWGMLFGAFPVLALEIVAIGGFLVWSRGKAHFAPWVIVTSAATAGFLAAAIVQGKGWTYHFYPALALIVLLLIALGARRPATRRPDTFLLVFAFVFFAQVWRWGNIGLDMTPIEDNLAALKPHPRLVSLASDLSVGFPAVRDVHGVWVDRNFARWIPFYAGGRAASEGFDASQTLALRAAVEKDRRGLAEDIRINHPDALLVERRPFDFLEWVRRDTELNGLLRCFHPVARTIVGQPEKPGGEGIDVEIWAAADLATALPGCARP